MADSTDGVSRRVLIVSASMGAGHLNATAELARRLRGRGHHVESADLLEITPGGKGRRLRTTYDVLLRRGPAVYDLAMRFWARWPRPLEALTGAFAGDYERALAAAVERVRPDVVVSTYNLSSQCLGRMKAAGRIDLPLVTYVTDPGAHPYWVHSDVDLHLAVTPDTAVALAAMGARHVSATGPLVRPEFLSPREREQARARFDLPDPATIALIAAGSEAYGHVEHTVRVLSAVPGVLPVVLCGRDERLRHRLERRRLSRPLGWVEDVPELMAAADVLIDNAGGLTCLEALASGLPVVVFRPLPGHGRFNAAYLDAAGLASWARTDAGLGSAVHRLLDDPEHRHHQVARGRAIMTGDVADEVLRLLPS